MAILRGIICAVLYAVFLDLILGWKGYSPEVTGIALMSSGFFLIIYLLFIDGK